MPMIHPDSLARFYIILNALGSEMINSFAVLDPAIKTFIEVVSILGPVSIAGVIVLLKNIEKDDPNRIRWK